MQNFCFLRFKSLVRYDLAENGRSYIQAMCIAFLVYFCLIGVTYFLDWLTVTDDYGLEALNWRATLYVNASFYATIILVALAVFFATSHLVVNRYCEARTATTFNMLPATHLEKGCFVLFQFFVLTVVFPLIFCIVTYIITYLAMIALGHGEHIQFYLWKSFYEVYELIWYADTPIHQSGRMLQLTVTLVITLIPVTVAIGTMTYEVIVTFFRNRHVQLKALFVYYILNNVFGFLFMAGVIGFAMLASSGYFDGLEEWIELHPLLWYLLLDILILIQIPILGALVWWFIKRLHYKEIR